MSARWVRAFVLAVSLTGSLSASAQGDATRDAARAFGEGTRAFDAGDFLRAAESFERAYALSPHEDALWNAARAWHRVGERARAANAYARYLREASTGARDRARATAALKELAAKLGRVDVQLGSGVTDARIDGAPLVGPSAYVVPGGHVLRATGPRGPVEAQATVAEGEATSVVLGAASPTPTTESPRAAPVLPPGNDVPAPSGERASGWSPVVVWVGGGVTVAAAAFGVWSGLDTVSAAHEFDAAPSQGRLDDGRGKQLRTNVAFAVAGGAALFTGVAALWLVDWRGPGARVAVGVDTGRAVLKGRF